MVHDNRGNTEGTNSLKILCLIFVYVLLSELYRFLYLLCLDTLWFLENLWFNDLCAE